MPRYLEIDHEGIAFHAPDPATQFIDGPPPTEVLFCDCDGLGVICHHTYATGNEFTVEGPIVRSEPKAVFITAHVDCAFPMRRQVFVDVTARKEVRLDPTGKTRLRYDAAKDTFTAETVAAVPSVIDTKLDEILAQIQVAAAK